MICTVLEVVKFGETYGLTDILYAIFALFFFVKTINAKRHLDRKKIKGGFSYYLYPISFICISMIGFSMFGATRMLQSQFRFIFNCLVFAIIYTYFHISSTTNKTRLVSSYIYVCIICSTFIVIQFLSFYIFHYNIKFDIGNYNAASLETFSSGVNYRTGGLFNEPSWFALFVGPALDITYRMKKYKELLICVLGMILSTSSMAFLFLFLFAVSKIKGNNKKYIIYMLLLVIGVYLVFPIAFDRLFLALSNEEGTSSNDARVFIPFTLALTEAIPLFGMDIGDLYADNDSLFLNTFVFILFAFGIVGLIIFSSMLYMKRFMLLSAILFLIVIIEGCYGRIDFWMTLLAVSVFCDNYRYR